MNMNNNVICIALILYFLNYMYIFIHVSQSHGHFFLHTHKRLQLIGKRLKKRKEPIEIIFSSLSKLDTDSADLIG